jgi:hypothetical protein
MQDTGRVDTGLIRLDEFQNDKENQSSSVPDYIWVSIKMLISQRTRETRLVGVAYHYSVYKPKCSPPTPR